MIVFLVVGVTTVCFIFYFRSPNLYNYLEYSSRGELDLIPSSNCLQNDVDISPIALTGMKQSGLCVIKGSGGFEFHPDDTYSVLDEKLWNHFPKLFDWLCKLEAYDTINSSWLVCMKPPRKSLIIYSDD